MTEKSRFEDDLRTASKELAFDSIAAMGRVAHCYGTGTGVPQDPAQAARWKFRELEASHRRKVTISPYDGPQCYDPEEIVDFFVDGTSCPRNFRQAKEISLRLLQLQEPRSILLSEKVAVLNRMGFFRVPNDMSSTIRFLRTKSEEGNGWATYQLALYLRRANDNGTCKNKEYDTLLEKARRMGNPAAKCHYRPYELTDSSRESSWKAAMSQMESRYTESRSQLSAKESVDEDYVDAGQKQWKLQADRAGVSGSTADTIRWAMQNAGWPAPNGYVPPAPPAQFRETFRQARASEIEGKDFHETASLYREIAAAGHPESMRRLGMIKKYILSAYDQDSAFQEGHRLLVSAAEAGDPFAQLETGRNPDPASMAAMAASGSCEAIMKLGRMLEQGQGGPACPSIAYFLYSFCWDLLGKASDNLNGEELLLKKKLLDCRKRHDYFYKENHLFWLFKAYQLGYGPAAYLLLLRPEFGRYYGHQNETDLAKAASDAGFAKAKYALETVEHLNENWKSYVSTREGRKNARLMAAVYNAALKEPGLPDIENLIRRGDIKVEPPEEENRRVDRTDMDESPRESEGPRFIDRMPSFINDSYNRTWYREGASDMFDCVCYRLSPSDIFNLPDGANLITDTTVYIHDYQVYGSMANVGSLTFYL